MAEVTDPLLRSPTVSAADSETPVAGKLSSLDEMIERCIGDFGWAQFFQAVYVSLSWAFDAQQSFISVFTDAVPAWRCTAPTCGGADICQLPRNSWAWDVPAQVSTVSEWSLECAGSITAGLPASCFFLGCLVGGLLLATLADSKLGRKNMLFLSCLLMSLAGLLTAVSTNIWMYSALRFVCGFARASICTCALVLATELVGKRWRGQIGVIGFIFFMVGFLLLPAIAYLNRGSSWRLIYVWTCAPGILYSILLLFFVRESPRWLFVQGRKEEFVTTLRSITPPENRCKLITRSFYENINSTNPAAESESLNKGDIYSAIRTLIQKTWALRRLCAVMVVGFGTGMVYYGMPLGVGNLGFNIYLSVTFNALSELPAALTTFFLIGRMNRRASVLGLTTLSGACSVLSVIASGRNGKVLRIAAEVVSFFSACTAVNVVLIYTVELFPTCVRNSALSMMRQALVLGGALSPVLVAAGRKNEVISYGVFGVMIGVCGLFVAFLPETRGGTACDTMAEEEDKAILNTGHPPA